jgi:hypothetical protein
MASEREKEINELSALYFIDVSGEIMELKDKCGGD